MLALLLLRHNKLKIRRFSQMALSGKYGKLNIPRVGEEEPVFVLRAQDRLAEPTIEMYRLLASSHGRQIAGDVENEIERFQQWSGNKKMPD
jgi:hypothetical protein